MPAGCVFTPPQRPVVLPEARRFPSGRRSHAKNDPRRRSVSCGHTVRFSATPWERSTAYRIYPAFSFSKKPKETAVGRTPTGDASVQGRPGSRPASLFEETNDGGVCSGRTRIESSMSQSYNTVSKQTHAFIQQHPAVLKVLGLVHETRNTAFSRARRKPARIPSFSRITKHETRNTAFYRITAFFHPGIIPMQHATPLFGRASTQRRNKNEVLEIQYLGNSAAGACGGFGRRPRNASRGCRSRQTPVPRAKPR